MTRSPFAGRHFLAQAKGLIVLVAIAGCQARDSAPQASFSSAGKQVISDAVHNDGTPGFYFLPPMVPWKRNLFGPFRPDVLPTVQIDHVQLSPDGCTSDCTATVLQADVAHWTRFGGSDFRRIRVFRFWGWGDDDDWTDGDDDVPDGYFVVRWDSDDFGVALHGIYRVRVFVPSNGGLLELGFADIEIVANRKEYRNVDTTEYTPLLDGRTLKIKFRIDTPALACVDVSCPGGTCDPDTGQCVTTEPPGPCAGKAANTVCRDAADVCELPARCDGVSDACPANLPMPADTVCRDSAGPCDLPAKCNGTSSACPANDFRLADYVCRPSAGACDAAETCTGSSAACPADTYQPASTVCRASAGACDVAETCTGNSPSCPDDAFQPVDTVCRASAGACDVAETCTGTSPSCPDDALLPADTVCRAAAGACDVAETCTGTSPSCPDDAFLASGTVCRGVAGVCDVAEACTGSSAECPNDLKVAAGTVCAPAQGACDLPAACDGSGNDCPANGYRAAGTVCRAATGQCDAAETCDGRTSACPADVFADGASCDMPICGPGPFVCRANSCVPSTTQCPPGTGDDGRQIGVCLPYKSMDCTKDDFEGPALDPRWMLTSCADPTQPPPPLGCPPQYDFGPNAAAATNLRISDASLSRTPSFDGTGEQRNSWIFDASQDLGNQVVWRQPIGINDFDVRFSFSWDWAQGQAFLAGIGLTNASNQLELRAGVTAPVDIPFTMAFLMNGDGITGDMLETGTADMHLNRAGGVLTIELNGQVVFCEPFPADIQNLAIFTVRGEFPNMGVPVAYEFGQFDLDYVQACRPTLNCAAGFADLGNGRCEPAPQ